MKRAGVLIIALVFVIAWSSLLWAQEKGEKKTIPDRGFMMYAARDGLFHVEAGKLAVQRASRRRGQEIRSARDRTSFANQR